MKKNILILIAILLFRIDSYSQETIDIIGKVVDESGNNLKDVTVTIEEATARDYTTNKGKFVLKVDKSRAGTPVNIEFYKKNYQDTTLEYTIKIDPEGRITNRLKKLVLKKIKKVIILKKDSVPEIKITPGSPKKIKIIGRVMDENGKYLDNAEVRIFGISDLTSTYGNFMIEVGESLIGSTINIDFSRTGHRDTTIKHIVLRQDGEVVTNDLQKIILKKTILSVVSKGNMIRFCFEIPKVIGKASDEKAAQDFPLGIGMGATVSFQHFLSDSNLLLGLRAGYLQWMSEGTDPLTDAVFKNKMYLVPLLAEFRYCKNYFYANIAAGIYITGKSGPVSRIGTDNSFSLPSTYSVGSHICFGFSPSLGYEIKTGAKSFINAEIYFSQILYPHQNIGLVGLKAGYNILLR